jgi:hypothetical protein
MGVLQSARSCRWSRLFLVGVLIIMEDSTSTNLIFMARVAPLVFYDSNRMAGDVLWSPNGSQEVLHQSQ